MNHPKVQSVEAAADHALIVGFDNNQTKRYNVSPLLMRDMFAPLRDPALFRAARVDRGGYAVIWNSEIDISEHELWTRGQAARH